MKKHSESAGARGADSDSDRFNVDELLGLGTHSARKSYYPALLDRIGDLNDERNRYKWLFDNALHGIFQANLRGGLISCNPALAQMCGYESPADLTQAIVRLREQLFCSVHDFDRVRLTLLSDGQVRARELTLLQRNGGVVDVALTLLRRPDLGPEVVEAFVADITERQQARKRLEQSNAELEARVKARTRELQEANAGLRREIHEREKIESELVVAVQAAEEVNRSKDKYLAAASHDLLQPLNAARLMISALQESPLPAGESRMVRQVHRALEGAEDLLADLLDISKLDQRAMVPDLTMTDMAALAKGLGEEFEAISANTEIRFRVRTIPAMVKTDQRMLTRILRNLLSNAFRYTHQGHVLLALRARRNALRIEVWDTGVGIEESKLREIFTEFYQLTPQGTGGRQGAGLGLAIVERMVQVLECQMDVASRPGQGSRFALTLPMEVGDEQHRVEPDIVAAQVFAQGFTDARILVIDNDFAALESMQSLLERWGCSVVTASSEAVALACLTQADRPPAAILADYHLDHDKTGSDAIQAIRQRLGQHLPAALITADHSTETRRKMRALQLPVLNKPVKPNRLRALLSSLLMPV